MPLQFLQACNVQPSVGAHSAMGKLNMSVYKLGSGAPWILKVEPPHTSQNNPRHRHGD